MNEFREVDCRRRAASSGCLDPASRNRVTAVMVAGSIRKALASTARAWTALGPASRTYVVLRDREDEQRDAAPEECAGDDVREPVDLQVRGTPGHADNTKAGEYPPPATVRAG